MYPVAASGGSRAAPVDLDLGGYRIPKGTQLWVPNHPLLNSPLNWERPDEYLPGRWADPDAEFAVVAARDPAKEAAVKQASGSPAAADPAASPGAPRANGGVRRTTWADGASGDGEGAGKRPRRFLPFSAGARDCVGQSLAKMNYTATLALLLSTFSFRLAEEVRLPLMTLTRYLIVRCQAVWYTCWTRELHGWLARPVHIMEHMLCVEA